MSLRIFHKSSVTDMTLGGENTILPQIVSFALPLFVGNIFQQLYNTADCFVVGKFLGRDSLAAIGSTSQLVFMVIGFFSGFSTGAQVVISQSFGGKDFEKLKKSVHTAVLSSFLISIFLTSLGLFASPLMLRLIQVPENVFALANSYLKIYFSGIAFLVLYNIGSSILRALGDSKRPLYFLIFSSVVNIALDLVFVVIFHLGVKGVAFATVISEAVSIIPVFYVLFSSDEEWKLSFRDLKIDFPLFCEMLKIGLPGAVSSSITAFSNTFMQKYINVFGSACIAGWAVFARFDQLVIMPMISISFAATTFVGQNFGAKNFARIKSGIRVAFKLLVAVIIPLSAFVFLFADFLVSIFISDSESVRFGVLFVRFTAPFYILCATTMLFSQIMRGSGNVLVPTSITFLGFVVLRQIILFVSSKITSDFAPIALAYPIGWIATTIAMVIYFRFWRRKWLKT